MHQTSPGFWRFCWLVAIALAWLLPNHNRPWLSFFADAWMTSWVLVAALVVFAARPAVGLHRPSLCTMGLALLPWIQYGLGILPAAGTAWLYSLFILALAFTQVLGAHWERGAPSALADAMFLAVVLASLLSVGLQIYQLLEGSHLGIGVMWSSQDRPFANLGQPNQLATLQLWGLVGLLWGIERGYVHGRTAFLAAVFLLAGVALTGSRAAWVGLLCLACLVFLQRKRWHLPQLPLAVILLALLFAGFVALVPGLVASLQLVGTGLDVAIWDRWARPGVRLPMWQAMLDAIALRPWFGWGVGQVGAAHMAVALDHANFYNTFSYAHNLVLDLWIWLGVPLGSLVLVAVGVWMFRLYRRLSNGRDVALFMVLVVAGNHAMLEMPLYYAYLLLPFGLFLGILQARVGAPEVLWVSRRVALAATLACGVLWGVLLRDYSRVEVAFAALENEWHRIQASAPPQTPQLWMLDQWETYFDAIRTQPRPGMGEAELSRMQQGLLVYPTMVSFHLVASSLALNGRPQEAREWLLRACKSGDCSSLKRAWAYHLARDPRYAAVPWPLP